MTVLHRLLIGLYPRAFRERFAADMIEQMREDRALARARGRLALLRFDIGTSFDLLRAARAARVDPAWRVHTSEGGDRMGRLTGGWWMDLRHAAASLRRAPGFVVVAAGTLGLAIGVNAGIFTVVDAVLLDPLPFADADRLVRIAASAPGSDFPDEFGVSAEFYVQYSEESELLDGLSTFASGTQSLRTEDRVERLRMTFSTPTLFETLGATPQIGRLPDPELEGGEIVISHGLWVSWFGADPQVLGRAVEAAGATRTIVGVMQPDFWFPVDEVVLWVTFPIRAEGITPGRFGQGLVGRLAPGATHEALREELRRLALRLPERFGGTPSYARMIEQHRPVVRSLDEDILGNVSGPLWLLMGAVAVVLLIACANVANLFIVRAERRQRDLAVRRAIGAGRAQLVRAQLAEAVVVAALSAPAALLLAWLSVPVFLRLAPTSVPRMSTAGVGGTTLLFTLVLSVVAGVACGLLPAIRASAPSLDRLRDAGRGSTRRRHWLRDVLVAGQTALALVLLIGAGLLVRSFEKLRDVDAGYDVQDVFSFQIAPEEDHLVDGPTFSAFHHEFMDRLRALPGVQAVGIVENLPLDEGLSGRRFLNEDTPEEDGGALVSTTFAAGDYFEVMGIAVERGRGFEPSDHSTDSRSVVVNRAVADILWPGADALGRLVRQSGSEEWYTVVGVVESTMQYGFRGEAQPIVYYPLVGPTPTAWVLSSPAYVLKTTRADAIAPEVRALVREVAPSAPMYRVYTLEDLAARSMIGLSFTMTTLAVAAGLAMLLGAIGLYGVLAYVVAERTQEIGVRMALGAEARRVRAMVVRQGARVVALGVVVGVVAAVGLTRVLGSLLFEVASLDATTFVATSIGMIFVGLLASYVPARKASSVDPIVSLRA